MFAPYKQNNSRWVRLHGNRARARLFAGEVVYFCSSKVTPGGPWNLEVAIDGHKFMKLAVSYRGTSLWKGSVEETAWQLAQNR